MPIHAAREIKKDSFCMHALKSLLEDIGGSSASSIGGYSIYLLHELRSCQMYSFFCK